MAFKSPPRWLYDEIQVPPSLGFQAAEAQHRSDGFPVISEHASQEGQLAPVSLQTFPLRLPRYIFMSCSN